MIPYKDQKIENAIAYFVKEYYKKTRKPLYQTFLYKFLAFLDFDSIKTTGEPALELSYKALERGPVPVELYEKKLFRDSNMYSVIVDGNKTSYKPKNHDVNLDYFSNYEISEMNRLIEIYAERYVKANDISESSHKEIIAWKKTWESNQNSLIKYEDEFSEDIYSKDPETMTNAEEYFLIKHAIEERVNANS